MQQNAVLIRAMYYYIMPFGNPADNSVNALPDPHPIFYFYILGAEVFPNFLSYSFFIC